MLELSVDTLEFDGKILGQQHRVYSSSIVPVGVDGYLTGVNVNTPDSFWEPKKESHPSYRVYLQPSRYTDG